MARPSSENKPASGESRSVTSDLARRIAAAKSDEAGGGSSSSGHGRGDMTGHGRAIRLGSEFIAAILVGTGIGYVIDLLLGTGPWVMLIMLLVGFGAGILNVVRATSEMNASNPAPVGADLGPGEDDEDE